MTEQELELAAGQLLKNAIEHGRLPARPDPASLLKVAALIGPLRREAREKREAEGVFTTASLA